MRRSSEYSDIARCLFNGFKDNEKPLMATFKRI